MKKATYVSLAVVIFMTIICVPTQAQPEILWTQDFEYQSATSIEHMPDGGFMLYGVNNGATQSLVKLSANGQLEWEVPADENVRRINNGTQTSDGGFIVVGSIMETWPDINVYLAKYDHTGLLQWSSQFDFDEAHEEDNGFHVQETDDGYVVVGQTYGSALLMNVYVIKTDFQGNEIWSSVYAGREGLRIFPTEDGGYILCGNNNFHYFGRLEGMLIKLDNQGNEIWRYVYQETTSFATNMIVDQDGGYVLVGGRSEGPGSFGTWLMKVDDFGQEVWNRVYTGGYFVSAANVRQYRDGYLISACDFDDWMSSSSMIFMVAPGDQTEVEWEITFPYHIVSFGDYLHVTDDGGYVFVSRAPVSYGDYDVWIHRYAGEGVGVETVLTSVPTEIGLNPTYPNPFNSQATVTFSLPQAGQVMMTLHDVLGRQVAVVANQPYQPGQHQLSIDGSGLASGVYLLRMNVNHKSFNQRITLVK